MYGVEGVDYKLENGVAVNIDNTPIENFIMDQLSFNLFINALPVEGESFRKNRKEEMFAFYDGVDDNDFLGFEIDSKLKQPEIMNELESLLAKCSSGEIESGIEETMEKLKENGIDSLLDEANSKFEEYKKGNGSE